MNILKCLLPLVAGLFSVAAWSASEAGSSASSATSAASNSIGASSTSLTTSSNSSSNDNKVAAGDYLIIDIAVAYEDARKDANREARTDTGQGADAATGAPAASAAVTARLTLRALNTDAAQRSEFVLVLPKNVVDKAGLAAGDTITARQRPYGLEFAAGATQQAFFLVLADTWYRELNSTAVVL